MGSLVNVHTLRRERPWVEFRAPTPCKDPTSFLSPLRRHLLTEARLLKTHFFSVPRHVILTLP